MVLRRVGFRKIVLRGVLALVWWSESNEVELFFSVRSGVPKEFVEGVVEDILLVLTEYDDYDVAEEVVLPETKFRVSLGKNSYNEYGVFRERGYVTYYVCLKDASAGAVDEVVKAIEKVHGRPVIMTWIERSVEGVLELGYLWLFKIRLEFFS